MKLTHSRKKNKELESSIKLYSEVNFLKYPFFALSRKGLRKKVEIVYKEKENTHEGKQENFWHVTANAKAGYPGPFDKKVHRAIESIISELPKPIENPIPFTLRDLCSRMNIADSGTNKTRTKNAIKRISKCGVNAKGTFYSKEKRTFFIDRDFHLYEETFFIGEILPDGEIADKNYLFLSRTYLQSLNSFYVKALDYKYLMDLRSSTAQRLYELLGLKFYGIKNKENNSICYLYSNLCDLLPVARQKYLSAAKQKLNQAFTELKKTNFLASIPTWKKKPYSKNDWYVSFKPGRRAFEEIKSGNKNKQLPLFTLEQLEPGSEPVGKTKVKIKAYPQAEKWVLYFYKQLHKTEQIDHEPAKKELALASKYLDKHGEEALEAIIDDTIKHAKETGWDIRTFGSIKVQAQKTISRLERRERDRKRQEEPCQDDSEFTAYNAFLRKELARLKKSAHKEKYDQAVEEVRKSLAGDKPLTKEAEDSDFFVEHVIQRLKVKGVLPGFEEWQKG